MMPARKMENARTRTAEQKKIAGVRGGERETHGTRKKNKNNTRRRPHVSAVRGRADAETRAPARRLSPSARPVPRPAPGPSRGARVRRGGVPRVWPVGVWLPCRVRAIEFSAKYLCLARY